MDNLHLKVILKYSVLVFGLLATALILVVYAGFNGWSINLDQIVKIVGLGVGSTSAIYSAMTLRHIYQSHTESVSQAKKLYSSAVIDKWLHPETTKMLSLSDDLFTKIRKESDSQKAYELLNNNHEGRNSLLATLSFLEHMAISINHEMADEELLKDFFGSVVSAYFSAMKGIIDIRRRVSGRPKLYCELEALFTKWS